MQIYRRPNSGVAAGDAIPFFFDGVYHLFHLSSPAKTVRYPERVRTSWEHARSKDLAVWEQLPVALSPGTGDAPDADGSWTGSVIEREGVFHLFYTGHKLGSKTPQTICHATSQDLVSFAKNPGNPIMRPDESRYESIDWRDPYVLWNEQEQIYWMLIAARLREGPKWRRGCIALATSPDLGTWSLEPDPFYAPMTTLCPECPELFSLNGRWYLIYSRFSENAATIYRVGDSPRGPWRVPAREALDGRRWYASKSMPKDDSARAFFGWVHDRAGDSDAGAWLWGGDFSAPREVTATPSGELSVRLPQDVVAAFTKPLPLRAPQSNSLLNGRLHLCSETGFDHQFLDLDTTNYLFACRMLGNEMPARFGLLLRSDDDLDSYALVFDTARSTVTFTRWPQPLDSFWADLVGRGDEIREVDGPHLVEHTLSFELEHGIECQIMASDTVIECYVGNEVALSYRVYRKSLHELGFFVDAGSITIGEMSLRSLP